VAGDLQNYDDGRRDLQLTLRQHFLEHVDAYNDAVFDNGRRNQALRGDALNAPQGADLVYLDPPYVPRSDDNCYIKRYHFLEGLSCYWAGQKILESSKVKKIEKPFTPFSYRSTAADAFGRLFRHFADSTIVLSYSSNAYPELPDLVAWMRRYKRHVEVLSRSHRYHFGTHRNARRNQAEEYLLVGTA
jgi:DNA adenine methylase/adenine-specific DNA-methyltransferase